jgi:hypothetical protein
VLARQTIRQQYLVTWEVDDDQVANTLPCDFQPALANGRGLVSLTAFRVHQVRLGPLPAPGFRQINVHTYVIDPDGNPAVFFFLFRTTTVGLAQLPLGVPVRSTVIRIDESGFSAGGLGVTCTFSDEAAPLRIPALDPPLGSHEIGYWQAAGLRTVTTRHPTPQWRALVPVAGCRFDPILALGFDVQEPTWSLHADSTQIEVELPPRKLYRG